MQTCILLIDTRAFRLFRARHTREGGLSHPRLVTFPVDLATSVEAAGRIDRAAWDAGLRAALQLLALSREAAGSGLVEALADPALCQATNSRAFLETVGRVTGLVPGALGLGEIAQLLQLAAGAEHADLPRNALLLSVEGEHLDLAVGCARGRPSATRLPLGVERLHRAYGRAGEILGPDDGAALFSLIRLTAGPVARRLRADGRPLVVASEHVGGVLVAARNLGCIGPNDARIDRVTLRALSTELLGAPLLQLRELGISHPLAPYLGTTAVILDAFADLLGLREITLGTWALPEGAALSAAKGPRPRDGSGTLAVAS